MAQNIPENVVRGNSGAGEGIRTPEPLRDRVLSLPRITGALRL